MDCVKVECMRKYGGDSAETLQRCAMLELPDQTGYIGSEWDAFKRVAEGMDSFTVEAGGDAARVEFLKDMGYAWMAQRHDFRLTGGQWHAEEDHPMIGYRRK